MSTNEFDDAVFKGVTRVATELMKTERAAYELENMIDGGECQPVNFTWVVEAVDKLLNRYALSIVHYMQWLTRECMKSPHGKVYEDVLGTFECVIEQADDDLLCELLDIEAA